MPVRPARPITAIIYPDRRPPDTLLAETARHLVLRGASLAGFVQSDVARPGRSRCDMLLEDLATGETVTISEDRGEGARGCRLQVDVLVGLIAGGLKALEDGADLLIVNKFGKTEAEGGGLRDLVVDAIGRGVPVLIAVPARNLDAWHAFVGDLSADHRLEDLVDGAKSLLAILDPDAATQRSAGEADLRMAR